jgi:hypothetical protein
MDQTSITAAGAIDAFLLLLIGIGPKLALVPFLEMTRSLDAPAKRRVQRTMLVTAGTVALILIVRRGDVDPCACGRDRHPVDRPAHRCCGLPLGEPGQCQAGRRTHAGHREGVRFLIAAIAAQLVLDGLSAAGVIAPVGH